MKYLIMLSLIASIANATQSVVVYRSKFEQQNDEFWTQFINDNPMVVLTGLGFALLLVFLMAWKGK